MRADLRHQKNTITPVRDRLAHDLLRPTVVVLPRVVHEGDACVDGRMNHADGLVLVLDLTDVMTAKAERRHHDAGCAEWTLRNIALHAPAHATRSPRGVSWFGRLADQNRSRRVTLMATERFIRSG